jgi:hypothetical protein
MYHNEQDFIRSEPRRFRYAREGVARVWRGNDAAHLVWEQASHGIRFNSVIPILRIFDIPKAEEFYQEFLSFSVDWDHRFDAMLRFTARFRAAI